MTVAEALLARLEREPIIDAGHASPSRWANRLLGRTEQERKALETVARSHEDELAKMEAEARIAVLLPTRPRPRGSTAVWPSRATGRLRTRRPERRRSSLGLTSPPAFGRREQAVALLQDASARGMLDLGSSHAYHADLLLAPLRGYPPFEALLQPDN